MDARMHRVIERFPHLSAAVEERFYDDRRFQEICTDYAEALEVLRNWEVSQDPRRASRLAEYRKLTEELAAEILLALRSPIRDTDDDLSEE
jgi:hypothetical protein